MLNFLFYAPVTHQKKILLEFVKPMSSEWILTKKIDAFDYVCTTKRFVLSVLLPKDEASLEQELKAKWKLFLEQEASYFTPKDYAHIDTLFREFPIDHIKVTKVNSPITENTSTYNFSATNLEVLQALDRNDYDLEYALCLFFTFIYCMGGFSPQSALKISQQLAMYKHFDDATRDEMNAQIHAIIGENKEEINKRLRALFEELLIYRPENSHPSVFSKWKLSYGKITIKDHEGLIPTFEHFKNQLLFSDAEVYMILSILTYFWGNYR
jgi:hypothetical protein